MDTVPVRHRFLSGALVLTSATAIAQLIALAAAPLITRLYSPEDFGLFAVFGAILAIGTVVACLRFELAIVLPEKIKTAAAVVVLCLVASIGVALLTALVILAFGGDLARWTDFRDHGWLLHLLPVGIVLAGLYRAGSFWVVRRQEYGPLAASKLGQSVPQTAAQIGFGVAGLGPMGLVLGDLIGKLTGNLVLWRRALPEVRAAADEVNRDDLKAAALRYRRFPLVSIWSVLINEAGSVAPALLLAGLFGPAVAGSYALVRRVLAIPMDLIGQSVSSVFTGDASRLVREEPRALRGLYLRYGGGLFLAGLVPAAVLVVFGESIFAFVFGEEWQQAGRYAQILSIGFLFRFAVSPLGQILNLLEKQHIQLIWDTVRVVLLMGALLIPYALSRPASSALFAYTAALVVAQSAYFVIALVQIHRAAR